MTRTVTLGWTVVILFSTTFATVYGKLAPNNEHSIMDNKEFSTMIAKDVFPATRELLRHFKGKFSIIVEPTIAHFETSSQIVDEFSHSVMNVLHLDFTVANYSYSQDFNAVVSSVLEVSRGADLVVLLMDVRLAKECLIAAHDVHVDTSHRVFVVLHTDFVDTIVYEREPYQWSTTDFPQNNNNNNNNDNNNNSSNSQDDFTLRNRKLCRMWEHVYVIKVTLPHNIASHIKITHDSVTGGITAYIRYRRRAVTFSSVGPHNVLLKQREGGEQHLYYPLAVFRYGGVGGEASRRCVNMLSTTGQQQQRYGFPEMHAIARFHLRHKDWCGSCRGCAACRWELPQEGWELSLLLNTTIRSPQIAICFGPDPRQNGTFRLMESIFIISGFVLLVLISVVMYQEFTKSRIESDFLETSSVSKVPVDV